VFILECAQRLERRGDDYTAVVTGWCAAGAASRLPSRRTQIPKQIMETDSLKLAGGTSRSAPFDLPPTDVKALLRNLTARGPSAALPQNLTDICLRALVRDIVTKDGSHDRKAVNILALTLAAARQPDSTNEDTSDPNDVLDCEPLSAYLRSYQLALIAELVDRQVGVHAVEYTVEEFFDRVMAKPIAARRIRRYASEGKHVAKE
jgi:hypothetical protein